MNKETLKHILVAMLERPSPKAIPRRIQLPLDSSKTVALLGIRRSGKTFILYETMQRLIAKGVDRRSLIYLNFEDDRLYPIRLDELDLILKAHGELYPDLIDGRRYLFLDEVQNAAGWEKYVRRVQDTENVRVFVTGSSSHLLQRDVASAMRGRSVSFEVFPLSFAEFLRFRQVEWKAHSASSEARVIAAFEEHLHIGGFPEIVLADSSLRQKIFKEYADLILYKDLLERYSIDNPHVVRLLLKQCLARPGSLLTVHKLYDDLRSQGIRVSKNTLYEYLDYMVESSIIFMVPKHSLSARKRAVNPRKVFSIDVGLCCAFTADPMIDRGHKLENVVFLHYRRQDEEISYDANGTEVDLVIGLSKPREVINVSYSLIDPDVVRRETVSLQWAGKKHSSAKRILLAHETPGKTKIPGVHVEAVWRFLLE